MIVFVSARARDSGDASGPRHSSGQALTRFRFTGLGALMARRPQRTQALLGIVIVVAYTATLPLVGALPAAAYPIAPFIGLGAVASLLLIMKYPAVLLGAYAGGVFSILFLLVPPEIDPVRGWSLLPVVAVAMYLLTRRRRISLQVDAALVSQLAFAVIVVAGVAYTSGSTSNALEKAWRFLYLSLFLFLATVVFARDARRQWDILRSYTVGAVLWAVVVYLYGSTTEGRLGFEDLADPIVYGRACGIAATLMACWLLTNPSRLSALIALPVGVFTLYGTVLSGTRGALVAFLAALLAVTVLSLTRGRTLSHLLVVCSILLGATLLIGKFVGSAPEELLVRYAELGQGTSGESAAERIYLYSVAARMLSESPLVGKGTGAYPPALKYPHNIFLEVGAELGAVGVLALCSFLTVTVIYVLRVLHSPDYSHSQKRMVLLLAGGLAFFLVEAQFSCNITQNRRIWFFCGLISAVHATRLAHTDHAEPQWEGGHGGSSPAPSGHEDLAPIKRVLMASYDFPPIGRRITCTEVAEVCRVSAGKWLTPDCPRGRVLPLLAIRAPALAVGAFVAYLDPSPFDLLSWSGLIVILLFVVMA